jgi:micrococcal nuclease
MRRVLAGLALGTLSACVEPGDSDPSRKDGSAPAAQCSVSQVVDGDTFDLTCEGQPAFGARLIGVDAPEIDGAKCPAEQRRGREARAYLERLLAAGDVTKVQLGDRLGDGRMLVAVEVAGADVGQAMVASGLAVKFDNKSYPDWCARL